MNSFSIGLFTKESSYCNIAIDFVKRNFSEYEVIKEDIESFNTTSLYARRFDYIISFLYNHLIPQAVLDNASIAAINFHPAPPEYPGTGSYNFALYNNEKMYGTVCHHMIEKPDSGKIIAVKRFPLFQTDTVKSLRERTMIYTLLNFFEVINIILEKKDLPLADEVWTHEPTTRKDLEKLLEINLDMSTDEIDKRIRSTAVPNYPGPYITIHGKKYSLKES